LAKQIIVMRHSIISLLAAAALLAGCAAERDFVHVEDGQFVRDGEKMNFVGTNFWYGPILGSEGRGGNRGRLEKELDLLDDLGLDNLRILVGSDGP
jgi:mannan endo-1,4-beta-mannosidase